MNWKLVWPRYVTVVVLLPWAREIDGGEGRFKSAANATLARSNTVAQARATAGNNKRRNKRLAVVVSLGSALMKRKMSGFASFLVRDPLCRNSAPSPQGMKRAKEIATP